jgi:parvulin-like peptidyl-prolyl isomerase
MHTLLALALGVTLSTSNQTPQGEQVVATVDGVAIKAKDVDKALWDWYSDDVVEEFIANTIVSNAVKAAGITLDPKEVDAFLNRLLAEAKAGLDPGADLEAELRKQGMPKARLASRAATEIGLRKITESRYKPAELRRISWILVRPEGQSADQKAAARTNAEEALKELETKPWPDVVRAKSQDANSAVRGGVIGWFATNEMPPDVAAAIAKLQPGQNSGVIESQGVFAIYRVDEIGVPEAEREAQKTAFVARNLDRVYQEIKAKAKVDRKKV